MTVKETRVILNSMKIKKGRGKDRGRWEEGGGKLRRGKRDLNFFY